MVSDPTMRTLVLSFGLLSIAFSGCESDSASPNEPEPKPSLKLAGVSPDRFECSSVTTTQALAKVLGAPARAIESASSVPNGIARPCEYEIATAIPEIWTYDLDCRDGYKRRADSLFEQYRQQNADRIASYNQVSDAGAIKPNDAGVVYKQPGAATDIAVGAKGLDHNDQAVIFIDDDAPCYVRVFGPDAQRRLELSKLIAKNLTFANAPMKPRPFK